MRKTAISLLAVVLLGSCGSAPAKRYFQMSLGEAASKPLPKIERTLTVEPATVDPLYDDVRIRYRVSPFEIEQYPYEFWAENPGRVVDRALADYFRKNQVFSGLVDFVSGGEADIVLRSTVHTIEEIDGNAAWQAHLAMSLEFRDGRSGQTLLMRTFDKRGSMKDKKIEHLPAALSGILAEELALAVEELARVLEK